MKNLFKRLFRRKRHIEVCGARVIQSCEDPNTTYIEYPDGLRTIFHEKQYVGWYVAEARDVKET